MSSDKILDELDEHFGIHKSIEVKPVTREELDKKKAVFRERKSKEKRHVNPELTISKESKPITEENKPDAEIKNKKSSSGIFKKYNAYDKNSMRDNIMRDEKFIYTLKCLGCNVEGEKILSEREFEQLTDLPHTGCGKGKVIALIKKPLPESETNTFYNAKIDFKFNPCKMNCFFNISDSNSYRKGNWICPRTAEHILACQNLVIKDQIKKIIENGITANMGTSSVTDFDSLFNTGRAVDVNYDDRTSVNVSIPDIRKLFVIRNCWSKQNPNNPGMFGIMEIKDEYGEVLGDEYLTDDIIGRSLEGETTIGVHQINKKGKLKWLCFDIDKDRVKKGTPEELADKIISYLEEWYGLTGYKENSGSIDSNHAWLFFEPTSVEHAYNFYKDFESKLINEGVDVSGFEKVISIGGKGGYGVMIKLPFNIQHKEKYGQKGGRSRFLGDISKIIPEKLPEEFNPSK